MQKAYQSNRADLLILHGNSKFAEIFWYFGYFQNGQMAINISVLGIYQKQTEKPYEVPEHLDIWTRAHLDY